MKNPFTKRLREEVSNLHKANTLLMTQRDALRELLQGYERRFKIDRGDLHEIRELVTQILDRKEPSS